MSEETRDEVEEEVLVPTESITVETEETNEAPESVEGEDATQVEAETPNEDVIAKRREMLIEGLIENETAVVKIEKSNRDVTEKSKVRPRGPHHRTGMAFGGPGSTGVIKRRGKHKQIEPKKQDYESRRGIAKVYPELDVKNVGEGINTTDIPARRKG